MIEIAERAGLTKNSFFRHFPDKREVLFGGDAMTGLLLRRRVLHVVVRVSHAVSRTDD